MDNMNLIPENEFIEVDGRRYVNPNLSVEATSSFVDNLRANQRANTAQIAQQTEALGTSVPSNEGGLLGSGSYFTSRYQTPQTSSITSNLRAAAQADALNTALANEKAMWQKRYQDAYRNYQKRQNTKENRAYGSGGNGNTGNQSGWNGETDLQSTDDILDESESSVDNNKQQKPPKEEDYMVDGEEQTKRMQERSGLPDWLLNVLKIFG